MARTLVHKEQGKSLRLKGECVIEVNGEPQIIDDLLEEVLQRVVDEHPKRLGRNSMAAILSQHGRAPDAVNKVVMDLRKWLALYGIEDLLKTARGDGYGLEKTWTIERGQELGADVDLPLDEIRRLCGDAKDAVERLPFMDTPSGAQFVVADVGLVLKNFQRFHEASWSLLNALSDRSASQPALILRLKKDLYKLGSYATFWRIGTALDEPVWKEEFRQEIDMSLKLIERLVHMIRTPEA